MWPLDQMCLQTLLSHDLFPQEFSSDVQIMDILSQFVLFLNEALNYFTVLKRNNIIEEYLECFPLLFVNETGLDQQVNDNSSALFK